MIKSTAAHVDNDVFPFTELERQLEAVDSEKLFRHIPSESTSRDRHSLLAVHVALRRRQHFGYLEIGSHLGGSLQAMVVDPRCERIISIDPRPLSQPDARLGSRGAFAYDGNSTARMLSLLAAVPGSNVEKIHTIDAGTDQLDPSALPFRPDLCFVDGEHTDTAVLRDARFCLSVVDPDGCIMFHDAHAIYRGLDEFVRHDLIRAGRPFRAYHLPDVVFVVELGKSSLQDAPEIRVMLANNYDGYLYSLLANDRFRDIANHPAVLFLRKARVKVLKLLTRRSEPL